MEIKKFRSPEGDIRVSDTSGHTAIITSELKELPAVLWGMAYAAGAISEDMQVPSMSSYLKEKAKELEADKEKELDEIKEALLVVYNNPVGYVDKDGRPLTRKVLGLLKKPVKKDVIDAAWDKLVLEQSEV